MSDELHAWRDGEHVAVFTRTARSVELHYDSTQVGSLSLSMPNGGHIPARRPAAWLEGLLPENPAMRAVLAQQHQASGDIFDLLQNTGADVAGAISLLPAGREPGDEKDAPKRVEESEVRRAIALLREGTTVPTLVAGSRMSVAGAQHKFSITRIGSSWFLPTASQPSTHIIKPAQRRNPGLDRLETASLALATDIGLEAARAELFDGAFMVERFDRETSRTGIRRRHMEDLSQALGLPPGRKYGVSAQQAIEFLREHTDHDQVMRFIAQLAYNTHLGNADAHAKNYSLFLDTPKPQLTPLYDTVPLAAFPTYDQHLAMKIAGARHAAEVSPHHWAKLARTTGLDVDEVTDSATRIATSIRERAADHGLADATRDATRRMAVTPNHQLPNDQVPNDQVPGQDEVESSSEEPASAEGVHGGVGGVWVADHVRNGRAVRGYWRSR